MNTINSICPSRVQELDDLIRTHNILLLDSDSIMKDSFVNFIQNSAPLLRKYRKRFTLLNCVFTELEYLSNSDDLQVRQRAIRGLEDMNALIEAGLVTHRGGASVKGKGSYHILRYVSSYIWDKGNIMVLSQDGLLAQDLRLLGSFQSAAQQYRITVKRLNYFGQPVDYEERCLTQIACRTADSDDTVM